MDLNDSTNQPDTTADLIQNPPINPNIYKVSLNNKEIIIVGTAHVSAESVLDIEEAYTLNENIDSIHIELDANRFISIKDENRFEKLDIFQIIKEKKGFFLVSSLILSSYQKQIAEKNNVKPGADMLKGIQLSEEHNLPLELVDREVGITLKRAWGKSSFWQKSKLIGILMSSAFSNEKIDEKQLETLKQGSELDRMMSELSTELPKIKEVLIDERDIYLAQKIFEGSGKKPLVILGAGHVKGVIAELKLLNEGLKTFNYKELEEIPKPTIINKTLPWFIPLALISIFVISLIDSGTDKLADSILIWTLVNGTLAALGAILSLAHPLTILASFIAAPITSLSPLVGVGMVAGLVQAYCMRPDFKDLKNLSEDSNHLKKWYTNKALKILLVVIATSIGSSIGTFFAIPFIASLSL